MNRARVLLRDVHDALLGARADDPLRGQFQTDVARDAADARLVGHAPRGVRVQVVAVAFQALHVLVEGRRALVGDRVCRSSKGDRGADRGHKGRNHTFHVCSPGVSPGKY
ncbi:hypothetical protein MSMEI_5024 [Mycolicibacterium smegmatis MC2 155]|uniref:Uncharacterized protein n=1 Tax=Mycolicibacterium smegmatis (strain ATCC 700084 / mc(2)155) TaxID=246196 RepID=I7FRP8_MYCS2|nr:hypothetical protein MSMEI_5024 [Mycolicibacterium smegmatis MC2 155]